ncbi:hypothetical protein CEXT_582301 [Caerostris extrusa]|uniref:Uncharacterized protein n=1 Tax=Caerostris extrusa TaxID=172846 RepID=A0AAV4QYI3_CAEEX|nr:hypothetical protein CEXT_582301 [Caerostris extrusa]
MPPFAFPATFELSCCFHLHPNSIHLKLLEFPTSTLKRSPVNIVSLLDNVANTIINFMDFGIYFITVVQKDVFIPRGKNPSPKLWHAIMI